MRKEIIIVTLAGIIFGLIIAFGIWRTNSALNPINTESSTSQAPTKTINNIESGGLSITIASPQNYDVIWKNPVNISGITKPNSFIIISTEDEDFVLNSNGSGEFDQEIELSAGVNQILISAQDSSQNTSSKNLTLVYSNEFAKQLDLE